MRYKRCTESRTLAESWKKTSLARMKGYEDIIIEPKDWGYFNLENEKVWLGSVKVFEV